MAEERKSRKAASAAGQTAAAGTTKKTGTTKTSAKKSGASKTGAKKRSMKRRKPRTAAAKASTTKRAAAETKTNATKPAATATATATKAEPKKLPAQEEAKRLKTAEEKKKLTAAEEKKRISAAEEKQQIAAAEEKKRIEAAEEAKRIATEEEKKRIEAAEEKKRLKAAEEAKRIETEEKKKLEAAAEAEKLESRQAGQLGAPEEPLKVLFVSPEVQPFAGTGGLGEVAGSLPKALNALGGIDCRVIMPLYQSVPQEYRARMQFIGYKDIPVAWRQKYMGVFSLQHEGVTVYFIDNEEYFRRDGLYGYFDDCERFAFFSRAVLEAIDMIGFEPDVIHANDWQTAMVPVYQDALYHREFCTTVFTIHNVEYQGQYGREVLGDVLGLPEGAAHLVEYNGDVNLMKGGIQTANLVSTVSPSYAEELKDPANAFGLDGMIRASGYKMRGILNGIDTAVYDPANDPYTAAAYDAADPSGKKSCKAAFQRAYGLPEKDVPLIVLISRLVTAKGIDLMTPVLDDVLYGNDVQFAVLGTGYHYYEDYFRGLAERHPDQCRAFIEFNKGLSHQFYAAADILLMPSKSEPCGLSQMIACRYGTVPVVRATGGLRDSIQDCSLGDGNGFVFNDYNTDGFYHALMNAVALCQDQENWPKLVQHDLSLDFSWSRSAKEYRDMYEQVRFH